MDVKLKDADKKKTPKKPPKPTKKTLPQNNLILFLLIWNKMEKLH